MDNLSGAGLIVDGWIVPEDVSLVLASGRGHAVDVLVGSNKDEGSFISDTPTLEDAQRSHQRRSGFARLRSFNLVRLDCPQGHPTRHGHEAKLGSATGFGAEGGAGRVDPTRVRTDREHPRAVFGIDRSRERQVAAAIKESGAKLD
jgi:hypothetical protein